MSTLVLDYVCACVLRYLFRFYAFALTKVSVKIAPAPHYPGSRNSRKSVRWSAVPVAPKLVYVRCEGERGSGPEGADDLCWA